MTAEASIAEPATVAGRDLQARFAACGHLSIDHIADAEDVAAIRAVCERLFASRAGFREGQQFNMVGADDGSGPQIGQILNPRDYAPELSRARFHAAAETLAKTLLGPQARLLFDHAIRKPAFDGAATPWHQDEAFRDPRFDYHDLSIWMPLQDVDESNGCMAFIPGDSGREVLPHGSAGGNARAHALECLSGFDPADAVACPVPAGGCTVHNGRTIHGAGPNRSAAPRYAYVLVFEAPKTPRLVPRRFPWLEDGRTTPRMERERAWGLTPAGLAVRVTRKLRQIAGRLRA